MVAPTTLQISLFLYKLCGWFFYFGVICLLYDCNNIPPVETWIERTNGHEALKFIDFSYAFIGNVASNFWVSTLHRGVSRTTFSGACLPNFGQFFLQIFENLKIWLCVMDLFIEKLVLKFGRNRSWNNEVMTILNIWWKKWWILFLAPWTPNFRIFWIFENGSCSSRWRKSNGIYPIKIGLAVLEISREGRIAPSPSPVNVLQKAHQ